MIPTKEHLDNMDVLASWLTNHRGRIELNMGEYSSERGYGADGLPDECGSSACGIGWATVALPGANRFMGSSLNMEMDFASFAESKFGENDGGKSYGAFLFSGNWVGVAALLAYREPLDDDDINELIGRLRYVIQEKQSPPDNEWTYSDDQWASYMEIS